MRGPGGGSRGGGFGRSGGGGNRGSGGFGRGPGGGGFGGHGGHHPPHRPHHHHHHHMPFFFGYRRPYYGYGYGGGCFGGLIGLMLIPLILIIFALSIFGNIFGSVGNSFNNIRNGGSIVVDADTMEDYAVEQYDIEFADAPHLADNILILFLAHEDCEDFQTIAIVGSNVLAEIDAMFGNETTAYGIEMLDKINPNYKNSISKNLAAVVRNMSNRISTRYDTSFNYDKGSPGDYQSHVVNKSNLQFDNATVDEALREFTENTDIPIVVVVDDYEDVFERKYSAMDIFVIILLIGLGVVAIYMLIRAFVGEKKEDGKQEEFDDENYSGDDTP